MEARLMSVPPLDNTLGCLLLGDIFVSILFGVATLQVYLYFDDCTDRWTLKFSVGLLWVLDAMHLAFSVHAVYRYSIFDFMDPTQLAYYPWSVRSMIVITTVSDTVVRSIYLHRIWGVSQKGLWRTVIIAFVSWSLMILNLSLVIVLITHQASFAELLKIEWVVCSIFGSSAAADIIIASSLCYGLWSHRTKIKRTNSIIRVLMMYTINTGILTCSCNIVVIITFVTMPHSLVFAVFYMVMPKLYYNSLMAMLNARVKLRENGADMISIPLSRLEDGIQSYTEEFQADKMKFSRDTLRPTGAQICVDNTAIQDVKSSL